MTWIPGREWLEESNVAKWLAERGMDLSQFIEWTWRAPETFWPVFLKVLGLKFRREPERILDISKGKPWAKWFLGSRLNVTDMLELEGTSVISFNERGDVKVIYPDELLSKTKSVSSWLKKAGLKKGDRVAVYMPMTAEIVPVMLGIVRAGMIAVPLFSGFGEEPVRVRIEDSESKVIFTVTSYERKGREIDLSKNLEKLRVTKVALNEGRKEIKDYHDLKDVFKTGGDGYEESEAEDPMMIVYTSGTTGRPKGCVHVHGGFPIKASADMYFHFDVRKGETVSWITDMGWMMGPWLVFGSLLLRSNVALFDGVPSAVTLSQFIESTSLSILGMSATLIRTLRSQSPDLRLEVRVVGNTGEPIDPENWTWIQKVTSAPVINYSGGTEISGGILGNYVVKEMKPSGFNGSSPGIRAEVLLESGQPAPPNVEGELVVMSIWPGMTRGFWRDEERYLKTYWSKWEGVWVHGDLAMRDEEGHFYIVGRSDDTIKVAGKRVGPGEIEAVINSHPKVVESACVGIPDPMKGEKIVCLVVPKEESRELTEEILAYVVERIGKALSPSEVKVVPELPKTRNAKIMRRLIRNVILGRELGDVSSLENPWALDHIKKIFSL